MSITKLFLLGGYEKIRNSENKIEIIQNSRKITENLTQIHRKSAILNQIPAPLSENSGEIQSKSLFTTPPIEGLHILFVLLLFIK